MKKPKIIEIGKSRILKNGNVLNSVNFSENESTLIEKRNNFTGIEEEVIIILSILLMFRQVLDVFLMMKRMKSNKQYKEAY